MEKKEDKRRARGFSYLSKNRIGRSDVYGERKALSDHGDRDHFVHVNNQRNHNEIDRQKLRQIIKITDTVP